MDVKLKHYPEEILEIKASFETDSLHAQTVVDILDKSLENAGGGALDEQTFTKIQQHLVKDFQYKCKTNKYWQDILETRYMLGKDFHSNYLSTLQNITVDEFRAFVASILAKGNEVTIIMDGTTGDVNTQNLFKENEFIKDFFNMN